MEETRRTTGGQRAGAGWVGVTRGMHRRCDAPAPFLADLHAWAQVLPSSARFTHLTAAVLHGLWLPPLPAGLPVFVAMSPDEVRPVRPGLAVQRPSRLGGAVTVQGLPVDPPEATLLALGRHLHELDLTIAVDSALQQGVADLDSLVALAAGRRRGAPQLRRCLAIADGRSESLWETALRRLHQVCGVDVEPQVEVRTGTGLFVARGDLWIRGTTVLHEYDGAHHLEVRRQQDDLRRSRGLLGVGWTRRGYTSQDVLHRALGVLRDADESLGRPHDPTRIRAWHDLLRGSCLTPAGRSALALRLGV